MRALLEASCVQLGAHWGKTWEGGEVTQLGEEAWRMLLQEEWRRKVKKVQGLSVNLDEKERDYAQEESQNTDRNDLGETRAPRTPLFDEKYGGTKAEKFLEKHNPQNYSGSFLEEVKKKLSREKNKRKKRNECSGNILNGRTVLEMRMLDPGWRSRWLWGLN